MDRARRSRARGGGRRLGAVEYGARGHGRRSYWWLQVCGGTLSTLVCSDTGSSAHGLVCTITGREELAALVEKAAGGGELRRGERGSERGLTVRLQSR